MIQTLNPITQYLLTALEHVAGPPAEVGPRELAAIFKDVFVDTVYFDAIVSDAQGDFVGSKVQRDFSVEYRFPASNLKLKTLKTIYFMPLCRMHKGISYNTGPRFTGDF